MVPDFFSSENKRIVIAGIKNIYTQGVIMNNGSMFAYPASGTLNSVPGKTHTNKLMVARKTMITMYPIREFRKLLISFISNENIAKY